MSGERYLRPATVDDMMLYFHWVNDPAVRTAAFQSASIDLATHRAWFAQALADEMVSMYVLIADGEPVGQVRLTWEGNEALIAYSVAKEARGHRYGQALLALVEERLPHGTCLVGQVKKTNIASRRVFLALGYKENFLSAKDCWEYRKRMEKRGTLCNIKIFH